jgi:hypothetical protein
VIARPTRIRTALLLGMSALAVVGCTRFDVRSNYDHGADFAQLKTYAWLPPSEADPADQRVLDRYIDTRIRADVATEMGSKGFRPVGSAAPDFLLNYRLATQPAEAVKGDRRLGIGWYGWAGLEDTYMASYDEGTLYIAVLDAQTKRIIWLGAASARIMPHISLERAAKRVDDAVHRILASFPPR